MPHKKKTKMSGSMSYGKKTKGTPKKTGMSYSTKRKGKKKR